MTTSIKIITNIINASRDTQFNQVITYNEDLTSGAERVGQPINVIKSSTRKNSGTKKVLAGGVLKRNKGEIINFDIYSKLAQGISIRNLRDTEGDMLPYIYIGNKSPYSKNASERMYPVLELNIYGVQDVIKNDSYTIFDDITEYKVNSYLNLSETEKSKIYPVLSGSKYNDQFKSQGTIDPLEVRLNVKRQIIDRDGKTIIHRKFFNGITCDIMGGLGQNEDGGNETIETVIEIREESTHNGMMFNDTKQETRLTNKIKPIPFSGQINKAIIVPFDDNIEYTKGKYSFYGAEKEDIIYGSNVKGPYSKSSEIGTRYIASTSGFVYESTTIKNTTLGTDSIAFGGLARR